MFASSSEEKMKGNENHHLHGDRKRKSVFEVIPEECLKYNVCDRFFSSSPFRPVDEILLAQCNSFYTYEIVKEKLIPLITQGVAPMRVCEWTATNYSKKHKTLLQIPSSSSSSSSSSNEEIRVVNIRQSYENHLKEYHRKNFDFYRRKTRCYFKHDQLWYKTTIGQLCVLRWIIKEGIIHYIERNFDKIHKDMVETLEKTRSEKATAERLGVVRKRKELSPTTKIQCITYKKPTISTFINKDISLKQQQQQLE